MVAAYGKFTLGDLECALDWGRSDFFSVVLGSAANSKSPPHACGPLAARALGCRGRGDETADHQLLGALLQHASRSRMSVVNLCAMVVRPDFH